MGVTDPHSIIAEWRCYRTAASGHGWPEELQGIGKAPRDLEGHRSTSEGPEGVGGRSARTSPPPTTKSWPGCFLKPNSFTLLHERIVGIKNKMSSPPPNPGRSVVFISQHTFCPESPHSTTTGAPELWELGVIFYFLLKPTHHHKHQGSSTESLPMFLLGL